jgi:hypothetical protein
MLLLGRALPQRGQPGAASTKYGATGAPGSAAASPRAWAMAATSREYQRCAVGSLRCHSRPPGSDQRSSPVTTCGPAGSSAWRHEAAVDQQPEALLGAQRRDHPVAAAQRGGAGHQGLARVHELAAQRDPPVFVDLTRERRPLARPGRRRRPRPPALDARDQRLLPGQAPS